MLEKFLKTVEAEKITKAEQKNINGGDYPSEICGEGPIGKPIEC